MIDKIPDTVILDVPYMSQNDNSAQPWNTCNTTALAMVAAYHGIVGAHSKMQLEDQFTKRMEAEGYNRFDMESMTRFLGDYAPSKMQPKFNQRNSVTTLRMLLAQGVPVIVSGRFTPSWHFIVLRGYCDNTRQFLVNDPYGEWWRTGYDKSKCNGVEKYSYQLIESLCNDHGRVSTIWSIECYGVNSKPQPDRSAAEWLNV